MARSPKTNLIIILVGIFLAFGIFANDVFMPLDVAGGLQYVAVVLISWWLPHRRGPIIVGAACTLLAALGVIVSPDTGPMWEALTGRILTIFAIWMATLLCLQYKHAEGALRQMHKDLEMKVEQRTSDLVEANARLVAEVAQRKRTEEALRASEQLHARAQHMAHVGHWERRYSDDKTVWSRETARILGLELSEVQPEYHAFVDLVHPDDRPRLERAMEAARTGGRPLDLDLRIIHPDGTLRHIHAVGEVRLDPKGGGPRIAGTIHDVTDRKQAEEQILRQQEELAHMSRLGSMGEMATGIAHELNQPLTSIVNYTQGCIRRVQSEALAPDELIAALAEVANEASRAGEIIRQMRRFIRKQETNKELVDVHEIIDQVVDLLDHELQTHSVELELRCSERLPQPCADRIQLQQVILNLIRNSLDAMEDKELDDRRIAIDVAANGHGVLVFSIRDSGCGLPEQDPDRVFEPFFTTKAQGTGMGLAISRTIIEAHGGHLTCRPNPDGGSTFEFSLPCAEQVSESQAHYS